MQSARKCWIDDSANPVFEASADDISAAGATITIDDGLTVPATFIVYFDEGHLVGRTVAVQNRTDNSYRILFKGKAPPRAVFSVP